MASHAIITAQGRREATGTMTCAVHLRDGNGSLMDGTYLISCLHVLALAQEYYPDFAPGASVLTPNDSKVVAHATEHRGFLIDQYLHSFDAAIARVVDDEALKQLVPPARPKDFISSPAQIPSLYMIQVPDREPIVASSRRILRSDQLSIPYRRGTSMERLRVWHRCIVESACAGEKSTVGGDSGSPVVSLNGDTLIGMHIAGAGNLSYLIPAFDLLDPANYYGLSSRGRIHLA